MSRTSQQSYVLSFPSLFSFLSLSDAASRLSATRTDYQLRSRSIFCCVLITMQRKIVQSRAIVSVGKIVYVDRSISVFHLEVKKLSVRFLRSNQ